MGYIRESLGKRGCISSSLYVNVAITITILHVETISLKYGEKGALDKLPWLDYISEHR